MGGRGTYSKGKKSEIHYKNVGVIEGVKVLQKIGIGKNDLPPDSHSSKAYIRLNHDGKFLQYREYNENKTWKFDIDYHSENKLTGNQKAVFHIHEFDDTKIKPRKDARLLTKEEFEKYKKFFIGRL